MMVPVVSERIEALRQRLPAQYLSPVLLLLGTFFVGIFLLLFLSTRSQDAMQRQRETQALNTFLQTSAELVQHDLQDYAKWDDAVRHITLRLDPDWLEDNVFAYLGRTQGYGHIFVLDGADRTIYAMGDPLPPPDAAHRVLGASFAETLAFVRRLPRAGSPLAGGYGRAGNRIMVHAVGAVVPLTGKVQLPPGPTRVLAMGRDVDAAFLAHLTRELGLRGVRLLLRPPDGDQAAVAIRQRDGRPVAWVAWTPHRPGTVLLRELTPAIVAMAALAVIASILILKRAGRSMEALRQSEMRARHHAHHDLLTGLPNRRALVDAISAGLAAERRMALIYMDLDGFKDANDVYGHAAGDLLLKEAAGRIRATVPGLLVARAGGDEFAVLFADPAEGEVSRAAEAIIEAFRQPFAIGAYRMTIGVSLGCAGAEPGDREAVDHDELMRRADVAMYAAKAEGKHCARTYSPALDDGHLMRMRLEKDLQASVANGEIFVLYQPLVDATTKEIIGVEALARWNHPDHGDVPPDVFIPIAEMSGLISELGRQVLHQACKGMRDVDVELAVNLSPAQFWDGSLLKDVQRILKDTGFPPARLELEITESLLLSRPDEAARVIDRLRALGIRIALDDFGTGFASIGYLQKLTLDRLKIDKAFIGPLGHDPKSRDMLMSIVGLAKALDLQCSAEGVETILQAEMARLAGCTRLQGWLFGKPMPIGEVRYVIKEMRAGRLRSA